MAEETCESRRPAAHSEAKRATEEEEVHQKRRRSTRKSQELDEEAEGHEDDRPILTLPSPRANSLAEHTTTPNRSSN